MTVHLFGTTSSLGCANLALRTAADEGVLEFGVEAGSFIKENFYVDDGLKSAPTVPEALMTESITSRLSRNAHSQTLSYFEDEGLSNSPRSVHFC